VGQVVDLAGSPFLVIGVLTEKLQMGNYGGPDSMHAVIPITTFAVVFGRQDLDNVVIKVARAELMQRPWTLLRGSRARYRFDPADDEVMGVWDTRRAHRSWTTSCSAWRSSSASSAA